jgi:uncharacterized membrane protein YedE/YeeE
MKQNLIALLCGLLFGIGLSLSQMVNPNKVLNFLDISGRWDPSLMFVMMGALAVAFVAFKWILKRPAPVLAESFHVSKKSAIDQPLLAGAAIFGVGWGMSGYCPGPAVAGLGLLTLESVIMVAGIYLGFFAYNRCFEPK